MHASFMSYYSRCSEYLPSFEELCAQGVVWVEVSMEAMGTLTALRSI